MIGWSSAQLLGFKSWYEAKIVTSFITNTSANLEIAADLR